MWATTLSLTKQMSCSASKTSFTQLSMSGVLVTNVGATGESTSCLVCWWNTKCFFGQGKKNLTVTCTGQPGLSVRMVALAVSVALAKAAANDFWFALLGLNILTFPLLPLVVAKLRLCGRGMPLILHLKVLQCSVAVQATADPASNENSVRAHFAVWLGGCFEDGFAVSEGTLVLAGFAAGGDGFLPWPELPVFPIVKSNSKR